MHILNSLNLIHVLRFHYADTQITDIYNEVDSYGS